MFTAIIGRTGTMELLVVLVIALLIFGPKQLPKLSQSLGMTVKAFKKGMEDDLNENDEIEKVNKTSETAESIGKTAE